MYNLSDSQQILEILTTFLHLFEKYSKEISGKRQQDRLNNLRTQLQKQERLVTKLIVDILGDSVIVYGSFIRYQIFTRDMLTVALIGGNNEDPINFSEFDSMVTSKLNTAIGTIEAGLWPPKEPKPILIIKDDDLRNRCSDLLSASGNYDRVIREATIVLEDRIRGKCPHDRLTMLIPQSADQTGSKLVNTLFSPKRPVLVISADLKIRIGFHQMLLGVFSHLRNPYHHLLDPATEWSWAWSTVGLVDRLLSDVDTCQVPE